MTTDLERALHDPAGVYDYPKDVVADDSVTHEQKIKILYQWKLDALELQVAEEENMPGDAPSMLNRVLRALDILGASTDPEHSPPTKHGGGEIE